MRTMFEVVWIYIDHVLRNCKVNPITVISESILPGATATTIVAIDSNGRTFRGSPENYFHTEEEAWLFVENQILENIKHGEEEIAKIESRLSGERAALYTLQRRGL